MLCRRGPAIRLLTFRRSFSRSFSRLVAWTAVLAAVLAIAGGYAVGAQAAERIEVVHASLEPGDDGWHVEAEFRLSLNSAMEDALVHGLPLYFKVEFELSRPRWYWLDDRLVSAELNWRLSYHALTRQYRLSTGTLQLSFPTLGDALGVMSRVHNWRVLDKNALKPGDTYYAAIRMRFDTSLLPKPFQINALTSREWTLESEWKRFTVTPEPAK